MAKKGGGWPERALRETCSARDGDVRGLKKERKPLAMRPGDADPRQFFNQSSKNREIFQGGENSTFLHSGKQEGFLCLCSSHNLWLLHVWALSSSGG
jgi:hypothetical protein